MDAAVVPMEPNFLTEEEVREAELDRVRQQVAAGLLGGPEHRNLGPPEVLREVLDEESSVQSKSIRSVDRKSNPEYARAMMLDILNEMSYPLDPKRRMRRAHLNASWAAACRQAFELAKDWGDGVCATEPLLQTLVANPELVEKLGFCTKPKGWAQDAALYKQYQSMLDIAASYGTLSRAATDAGLAFDDNDEGTIQSGEFDDQDWSYREFEEAVVRLVRACRGEVAREQAERERYAANAERVSKKKVKPKKGLFGALVARGVD